jgi:hypothetical protein
VAKKVAKVVAVENKEVVENKPAAVVTNTDPLELTGGFYQKKSLEGAKFEGGVKISNGVVEALYATLPDGKKLNINIINQEMVGNVFQFEDSETREIKSGLFYAVNAEKGEYMLNLTDDSNFAGIRLEFKDPNLATAKAETSNWAMNEQHGEEEKSEEFAQDDRELEAEEPNTQEGYEEEVQDETYAQNETEETYAFAF